MLKRRFKIWLKVLLMLGVIFAVFLFFERVRGQMAFANYKKALIAKGEKLSPQDFFQSFSEEDNGAPVAIATIQRLADGEILPRSYLPRMQVLASGRAIVGFREPEFVENGMYRNGEWIAGLTTNRWEQLESDLQKNAADFEEIHRALAKPVLNNNVDFSNLENNVLLHLSAAKSGAQWFGNLTQTALHKGDREKALESLLGQLKFLRLLAADHILISELTRVAIGAMALTGTWEVLQADGWTDAELLRVQQAWADERFLQPMTRSLEGEFILYELWHKRMRASNDDCFKNFFFQSFYHFDYETHNWVKRSLTTKQHLEFFWKKHIYTRLWRFAWSYQTQTHGLTGIHALVEIGQNAATNQSNRELEQSISTWTNQYDGGGFYRELRRFDQNIDGLQKALSKAMRAETDRSLTITAIALKRHHLRHGKYPNNLDALVPEFLPTVPTDYMDGKPIKYRLEGENNFTLYSVGENGRDDGGDLTTTTTSKSRYLWLRRDYVWPTPATPEEVEEYRREANKN